MAEHTCRADGCDRTFETEQAMHSHEGHAHPDEAIQPWHDRDKLYAQYVEEGKLQREIADEWGTDQSVIGEWLHKHDIPVRNRGQIPLEHAPLHTNTGGYELWRNVNSCRSGERNTYPVHRLLAIAEYGPGAVAGKPVHHKNGVPWDNRPENIEPVSREEHANIHYEEMTEMNPVVGHE